MKISITIDVPISEILGEVEYVLHKFQEGIFDNLDRIGTSFIEYAAEKFNK